MAVHKALHGDLQTNRSGEQLRSNTPRAQMDKHFHTSQRREAPLGYNTTGSNGTANANVTAERSSALIHHHWLKRKGKCNYRAEKSSAGICIHTLKHECNTSHSGHQIRSTNHFKAENPPGCWPSPGAAKSPEPCGGWSIWCRSLCNARCSCPWPRAGSA
jgi:hypothetical protein